MTAPLLLADYATALPELVRPWQPLPEPTQPGAQPPEHVAVNEALASKLGVDLGWVRSREGLNVLGARAILPGSTPVAQAYAGHQFGGFSPLLGDGRAVLLGELRDGAGRLRDLALKGSGRTTFARGGDGRAVLGPVLREYLMGEAMHALGIPTTRALTAITTGDRVFRDGIMQPGAVLARVAASHLRVGTFEVVARSMEPEASAALLPRLVTYAVRRHYPDLAGSDAEALGLLDAVVAAQAELIARWSSVGFVHGVMNTDNTTISGETIDYGPCAWLETYDEDAVFSSIDTGGRYRFGYQASIGLWNLSRLGECLLPLIDDDPERAVAGATGVLETFAGRYRDHYLALMADKLGLARDSAQAGPVVMTLLESMAAARADYTLTLRRLADYLRGDEAPDIPGVEHDWLGRWTAILPAGRAETAAAMDAVNPLYVPRNHLVDAALTAAGDGDLAPFERLLAGVSEPYAVRPGLDDLAAPAPPGFTERHVTYCGT
ncbi:protein adenylyltransferase SelO [Nostocoides australiense]|nr:YdiU family protein [Tetrasphaera sp.]HPF80103.1 YdiU family protein [Tetrasphaera australiensis]HRW02737.1 YdiU family protein [Tetrasphaera sp.]